MISHLAVERLKPPKKCNKIFHLPMFKPWRCSVEFRVAHETDAKIPVALKAQRAADREATFNRISRDVGRGRLK